MIGLNIQINLENDEVAVGGVLRANVTISSLLMTYSNITRVVFVTSNNGLIEFTENKVNKLMPPLFTLQVPFNQELGGLGRGSYEAIVYLYYISVNKEVVKLSKPVIFNIV